MTLFKVDRNRKAIPNPIANPIPVLITSGDQAVGADLGVRPSDPDSDVDSKWSWFNHDGQAGVKIKGPGRDRVRFSARNLTCV